MRTALHYISALVLLTFYGGQVCPLIDTLTIPQWGIMVALTFVGLLTCRHFLLPRVVETAPLHDQPGRQFLLEFLLFLTFGILLSKYNTFILSFPIHESAPKVILGFATFGFFAGLDLALARERITGLAIIEQGVTPPERVKYTTLTLKFSYFALATILLVGTILILAVIKDLYWLTEVDMHTEGMRAQLLVVAEIGFIFLVLGGYIINTIISYTRNIRFFFSNETQVLRKVQQGDLSSRVPHITRDEFAEIAAHTNTMIDGLRERDRIKNVFGKAVSPTIARRLIEQEEQGISLGGSLQPLVILFSDIRNFTAYSEANPPDMVIKDLNLWFSEAIQAIRNHGGIVDKFIGDGILAVFGLDNDTAACQNAVDCATEMHSRLQALTPQLCAPMQVGIGVHKGEVLAGIVGSPERLEFTVIGDVVNTASRIEGLTRDLNATILISDKVHNALQSETPLSGWKDYGPQKLKGKTATVHLYGLTMEN